MREIKFRGKVRKIEFFETVNDTYPINKDYWVYGWLVKDADGKTFILPADETHVDDKDNKLYFDGEPIIPEVDPETIGEYTGQKDKNGREIYEGDIMRDVDGNTCEVIWQQESAGFRQYDHVLQLCDNFIEEEFDEIIGNIHDDPEFLKE